MCRWVENLNGLFVDDTPYKLPSEGDSCLTVDDLNIYGKGKRLYGWHISNYKYYKEPKGLADFGLRRPPQSWCYVDGKKGEKDEH